MSAGIFTQQTRVFHARSNARAALTALRAIVGRDLLVLRRELILLLVQTLIQPLFFLFVFGKILPMIGQTNAGFAALFLPGVVALSVLITALQGPAVDVARDLSFTREIEDRLLAPLPIALVALEKIVLAALRALLGGALVFPLAYWMLGSAYEVRTDRLAVLIGLMVLMALVGAALGMLVAVVTPAQFLSVIFALVFTPLIFTGCAFYPWASLNTLHWYQIATLFNPLTYASEGMRYAMIPPLSGQAPQTLAIGWVVLALSAALVVCLASSITLMQRRVVS